MFMPPVIQVCKHRGTMYEQFFYGPEALLALLVTEIETSRKFNVKNLDCDPLDINFD